jgi:hypothetical protein
MSAPMLPTEFADLEPFAAKWCLANEHERYAVRLASSMEEMHAFYDAAFPRMEDAMAYLDQFPLDELPDDATNLLHLLYSLVNVSFPVETWHQPNVPDAGATYLDLVVEPTP